MSDFPLLAIIIFLGVKFGGYVLAGLFFKARQPMLTASAFTVAWARGGMGILIGLMFTCFLAFVPNYPVKDSQSSLQFLPPYLFLTLLRFLAWMLVIWFFARSLDRKKLALYAFLGAAWSCLLDVPAWALTAASGTIPFC